MSTQVSAEIGGIMLLLLGVSIGGTGLGALIAAIGTMLR